MKRLLSSVDPKANWITFAGIYQLLGVILLVYGVFALFPPDLGIWWNVPVSKGERVGIGGYLLVVAVALLLTVHTIGMILRSRWAVLAAGLPYLAFAVWRTHGLVNYLLTHSIKWNVETSMDLLTSCFMIGVYVHISLAALRILSDILDERRKSSVDVQVA